MENAEPQNPPLTVHEMGAHQPFFTTSFLHPRFLHELGICIGNKRLPENARNLLSQLSQVDQLAELARRSFFGQQDALDNLIRIVDSTPIINGLKKQEPDHKFDHEWKPGKTTNPLQHLFSTGPVLDIGTAVLRASLFKKDLVKPRLLKAASYIANSANRVQHFANALAQARTDIDLHNVLHSFVDEPQLNHWPMHCLSSQDIGRTHLAFPALLETLVRMVYQWKKGHGQLQYNELTAPRSVLSCHRENEEPDGRITYNLGPVDDLGKDAETLWCGNRAFEIADSNGTGKVAIPPLTAGPLVVSTKLSADAAHRLQEQHHKDGTIAPHGWRASLAEHMAPVHMAPALPDDTVALNPRGSVLSNLEIYDAEGNLVGGRGLPEVTLAKGAEYRLRWKFIGTELPQGLPRIGDEYINTNSPRWNYFIDNFPELPIDIEEVTLTRRLTACIRQGKNATIFAEVLWQPIESVRITPDVPGLSINPHLFENGLLIVNAQADTFEGQADLSIFVDTEGPNLKILLSLEVLPDTGVWRPGGRIGVVATHAALLVGPESLEDVKVICFGYDESGRDHENKGEYQFWDPITRAPYPELSEGVANRHDHSPFCSGHAFLPNGDLLVAGGHIAHDLYDGGPAAKAIHRVRRRSGSARFTAAWEHAPFMENDRWYPTVVTLASGRILILGGSSQYLANPWNGTNEDYEIYDPTFGPSGGILRTFDRFARDPFDWERPRGDSRDFTSDDNPSSSLRVVGLYPHGHLLPADDSLFTEGVVYLMTEFFARLYDPTRNGLLPVDSRGSTRVVISGYRTWHNQGSSVLLPIDIDEDGSLPEAVYILAIGGSLEGENNDDEVALDDAELLVYNVQLRTLQSLGTIPLDTRRFMGDSVLLPTGQILVVNGARRGYTNENSDPVFEPTLLEITGSTSTIGRPPVIEFKTPPEPPSPRNRRYHSTALLLPDGAVFVGGSSGGWGDGHFEEQFEVDVYEPWYFTCQGRPEIIHWPTSLNYGQTFTVTINSNQELEKKVILIRFSSVTHQLNTDQRLLRLAATDLDGMVFRVNLPRNRSLVPPGPYLLYVLAATGIPSVGRVVIIGE